MESDRCFLGYERMKADGLSLKKMRQMCDLYVRILVDMMFGGSSTYLDAGYLHEHRFVAELALDAFNNAKGRNFKLVKFLKCNRIVTIFYCLTFEAKEDGSDVCLLFRAVVNGVGTDKVLLCEIRDGDESKDLSDDILSLVTPPGQYICLKHEFGECHSTDGSRGGKCDYAVGFSGGKCGCAACMPMKFEVCPPPSSK
ncbi:uncharacterized protein [Henckelia pumila]